MIYTNLHAILATTSDGLIGDGDKIPWHHSGDMKHFKEVTMGSALIIGLKTVEGIAKNYFQGKELLPGRMIYIIFEPRDTDINKLLNSTGAYINWNNTSLVPAGGNVNAELNCIMEREKKSKVFLAGGAKTYDRFIGHACDVYLTLIHQESHPEYNNPVYLSQDLQHSLFNNPYGYKLTQLKDSQIIDGTTAKFLKISKFD